MAQDAKSTPTDERLMESLLYKVLGVRHLSHDHIRAADLYGVAEPWEIFGDSEESKNLCFFSKLKAFGVMDHPKRFCHTVGTGRWVTRAKTIEVYGSRGFMGYNKRFRYLKGSGDNNYNQNYKWHMDEYSLRDDLKKQGLPVKEEYEDYALCVLWKIAAANKVGSSSGKDADVESGFDHDDRRENLIQG